MSKIILPNYGQNVHTDYNEADYSAADSKKIADMELAICNRIGNQLVKHYPNREWKVHASVQGQMIIIACDSLSTERGYYLPMYKRSMEELERRAVRAAGEVLERFNVSRDRKFNPDHLETLDRDLRDEVISSDALPEDITKGLKHG